MTNRTLFWTIRIAAALVAAGLLVATWLTDHHALDAFGWLIALIVVGVGAVISNWVTKGQLGRQRCPVCRAPADKVLDRVISMGPVVVHARQYKPCNHTVTKDRVPPEFAARRR